MVSNSKPCDIAGNDCKALIFLDRTILSVIIVFRGNDFLSQLNEDLHGESHGPSVSHPAGGKVLPYFYNSFLSLWPEIKTFLHDFTADQSNYSIMITGHGSGGALAALCAIRR